MDRQMDGQINGQIEKIDRQIDRDRQIDNVIGSGGSCVQWFNELVEGLFTISVWGLTPIFESSIPHQCFLAKPTHFCTAGSAFSTEELEKARLLVNDFLQKNRFEPGKANSRRSTWCSRTYSLHEAVKQENVYIVSKLLLFGADPSFKDMLLGCV